MGICSLVQDVWNEFKQRPMLVGLTGLLAGSALLLGGCFGGRKYRDIRGLKHQDVVSYSQAKDEWQLDVTIKQLLYKAGVDYDERTKWYMIGEASQYVRERTKIENPRFRDIALAIESHRSYFIEVARKWRNLPTVNEVLGEMERERSGSKPAVKKPESSLSSWFFEAGVDFSKDRRRYDVLRDPPKITQVDSDSRTKWKISSEFLGSSSFYYDASLDIYFNTSFSKENAIGLSGDSLLFFTNPDKKGGIDIGAFMKGFDICNYWQKGSVGAFLDSSWFDAAVSLGFLCEDYETNPNNGWGNINLRINTRRNDFPVLSAILRAEGDFGAELFGRRWVMNRSTVTENAVFIDPVTSAKEYAIHHESDNLGVPWSVGGSLFYNKGQLSIKVSGEYTRYFRKMERNIRKLFSSTLYNERSSEIDEWFDLRANALIPFQASNTNDTNVFLSLDFLLSHHKHELNMQWRNPTTVAALAEEDYWGLGADFVASLILQSKDNEHAHASEMEKKEQFFHTGVAYRKKQARQLYSDIPQSFYRIGLGVKSVPHRVMAESPHTPDMEYLIIQLEMRQTLWRACFSLNTFLEHAGSGKEPYRFGVEAGVVDWYKIAFGLDVWNNPYEDQETINFKFMLGFNF